MATNSLIVRANRDGSFDAIKVHFGHPDSLGPKLLLHFNDDAKIAELLALGQLSTLEAEIGEKHRFNDPHPGWCIAYERDRGDDPVPARHHENLEDLVQSARKQFVAHVFVWTINPETEQRGWAKLRMPQETEASVRAIVEAQLETLIKQQPAPLGLDIHNSLSIEHESGEYGNE